MPPAGPSAWPRSDTALADRASRAMHQRLGFSETERVVFFAQALD